MPPGAPRFSQSLESSELENYLSQGTPVVVTDIDLQGTYDPLYFQQRFWDKPVILKNCETGEQKRSTVFKFFETFGKPWLRNPGEGIWKLKVRSLSHTVMFANFFDFVFQDWPPQKDFRTEFPVLYEAFVYLVACPHVARPNGALNCVAHFPENGIMPDLGKISPPFLPIRAFTF
jgi:lysine-specific demethylase 3